EAVFEVIEQEPDRLREVTGIGPKRAGRKLPAQGGANRRHGVAQVIDRSIMRIGRLKASGCQRLFWAMTSAIVRCSRKAQLSPTGTSRAAMAVSTSRQRPCAGKPITASRGAAQARQLLQVASV